MIVIGLLLAWIVIVILIWAWCAAADVVNSRDYRGKRPARNLKLDPPEGMTVNMTTEELRQLRAYLDSVVELTRQASMNLDDCLLEGNDAKRVEEMLSVLDDVDTDLKKATKLLVREHKSIKEGWN
jgi:hypothetical protein